MKILQTYDETRDYISRVQAAADGNRDVFGFLPNMAYEYQAQQNKLWVAINDNSEYIGHLMFGGVYPVLRVIQIHVEPCARKAGVGKQLFNQLKQYGETEGYLNIRARVASDLEANHFYNKLGFNVATQKKGGETTGRVINIRNYELNVPSLFDSMGDFRHRLDIHNMVIQEAPILSQPTYAFDLNVIHDTVKDRGWEKVSGNIFARSQMGEYKLCATPELITELERTSPATEDPLLNFAKNALPILAKIPNEKLSELISELDKIIFRGDAKIGKKAPNKLSDLKHLAYAIQHKLTGFITRDNAILSQRDILKEKYRINILSPYDFDFDLNVPDNMLSQDSSGESLHFVTNSLPSNDEIVRFASDLGIYPSPELFGDKMNASHQVCTYVKRDTQIVGLAIISSHANKEIRASICVNENASAASKIIDHLLAQITKSSLRDSFGTIKVTVPVSNIKTIETLQTQGFFRTSIANQKTIQFKKASFEYILSSENWDKTRSFLKESINLSIPAHFPCGKEWQNTGVYIENKDKSSALSLFEFETIISPTMVIFPERTGIIMPIEYKYSRLLFGNTSAQTEFSLLVAEEEALSRLEKAYFCTPRKSGLFHKGTKVVFYESSPNSYAVGWARITSSSIRHVDDILLHYSRQGVLQKEALVDVANTKGEIRVVTFDNFVEFTNKISHKELKSMGCDNGANFVTAQKIGSEQLRKIAEYAFKR